MNAARAPVALSELGSGYDLVVIGGGITGAGIFREAVDTGARVLLVEQGDYASGTSSASSKLVHGGLRYLKSGQWRLTLESVRERQRLLEEAPGLVAPQTFLLPLYQGGRPGRLVLALGLRLYELMAGTRSLPALSVAEVLEREPTLRREGLQGGLQYQDARTDDCRLTLRLILDGVARGGHARNYTRALQLLKDARGHIHGVALRDDQSGATREVEATVVVNASGPWAPGLGTGMAPALRPLRGSHLVFAADRMPIRHAISWAHPRDGRPVFAYPWEGAVVYGTTDLDHGTADLRDPAMNIEERDYLEEGLARQFPDLNLGFHDALSSYAGVRPVVSGGKTSPSAESRESALWSAPGLVGITGGKLTTFRVTAREVLAAAAEQHAVLAPAPRRSLFAAPLAGDDDLRLQGRLGPAAALYRLRMPVEEQRNIPGTVYELAELRWAARHEQVVHLDDLLLRRTRLGLVAPQVLPGLMAQLQSICVEELGWDQARWQAEVQRYRHLWQRRHAPGGHP